MEESAEVLVLLPSIALSPAMKLPRSLSVPRTAAWDRDDRLGCLFFWTTEL
jgi:hypothetical protein